MTRAERQRFNAACRDCGVTPKGKDTALIMWQFLPQVFARGGDPWDLASVVCRLTSAMAAEIARERR